MNIMPCRFIHLMLCLAGYQKTGIPLTEFYQDNIVSFFAADDIGIYILIPKLASLFNLSILQAVNLFFYGSAFFSWLVSIIGFFFYYSFFIPRMIAFVGISLLMLISLKIGDTYLFYVEAAITLIPWSLYFFKSITDKKTLIFYVFAGCFLALAHYIRTYASIGALFFVFYLIVCKKEAWKQKLLSFSFLVLGLLIPVIYFTHTFNTYAQYIKQQGIENPAENIKNHLIWHSIYAGFGFLSFKNPERIEWGDSCATKKAQSIDPTVEYNTPEYEEILKHEVLKLIKKHPVFIIMTIFSKIGILLLYFLTFANLGIIAALFYPKKWSIELAFWGALSLSSIFSILTIPTLEYSLGFIAFSTLYGIVSINQLLLK